MCCPQCETKIIYYLGTRSIEDQKFVCHTCGRQFTAEQSVW